MSKRLSVILGDVDEELVEPFVATGTVQHAVLQRWAALQGAGRVNSEAAAIRALMRAGAAALQDEVLEAGYADLVSLYNEKNAQADRRAARERYVSGVESTL